jgi:hypothetical protein
MMQDVVGDPETKPLFPATIVQIGEREDGNGRQMGRISDVLNKKLRHSRKILPVDIHLHQ